LLLCNTFNDVLTYLFIFVLNVVNLLFCTSFIGSGPQVVTFL